MDTAALTPTGRGALTVTAVAISLALAGCGRVTVSQPMVDEQPTASRTYVGPDPVLAPEGKRTDRHRTFMAEGIPVEYVNRINPRPPTQPEIEAGGRLYAANCAGCHDARGTGHGEAGRGLELPPAVLAALVDQPYSVDQYLFWAISEGGQRTGSQMPAFKSTLTADEIWQIVNYMRAGFPAVAG